MFELALDSDHIYNLYIISVCWALVQTWMRGDGGDSTDIMSFWVTV